MLCFLNLFTVNSLGTALLVGELQPRSLRTLVVLGVERPTVPDQQVQAVVRILDVHQHRQSLPYPDHSFYRRDLNMPVILS